jgi:hypothetical protein
VPPLAEEASTLWMERISGFGSVSLASRSATATFNRLSRPSGDGIGSRNRRAIDHGYRDGGDFDPADLLADADIEVGQYDPRRAEAHEHIRLKGHGVGHAHDNVAVGVQRQTVRLSGHAPHEAKGTAGGGDFIDVAES